LLTYSKHDHAPKMFH